MQSDDDISDSMKGKFIVSYIEHTAHFLLLLWGQTSTKVRMMHQ